MTDLKPDSDLDRVADIAYGITEKLRDNPTRLYGELTALCQQHPAKYAQITMVLAAWFDDDTTMSALWRRVEAITEQVAS